MGITFNADEVFEMAIEIERRGVRFYRQAADVFFDRETKRMLLEMAKMEDGHRLAFERMRDGLGDEEKVELIFDPDNEGALYLQAMADAHGWEGKASAEKKFVGDEKIEDVLKSAIEAEKDSVIFYAGLKSAVSVKAGKAKVEAIIGEELGHITMLKNKLSALVSH